MKSGARMEDQNEIKRLTANGLSAEEISATLQIEIDCVESFMAKFSKDEVAVEYEDPIEEEATTKSKKGK